MEYNKDKKTEQGGKKISKALIFIGIAMLVVGIILMIVGSKIERTATDNWMYGDGRMPGLLDILVLFIGFFVTGLSLPAIFIGLTPYITKAAAKLNAETLDYAGDDLSNMGMKTVDVVKPVAQKGYEEITKPMTAKMVDDVVIPTVAKVKDSVAKVHKCPNCGDEIEDDEEFCSNCGKQLKKKCETCGTLNSSRNKFCKKCGKELIK